MVERSRGLHVVCIWSCAKDVTALERMMLDCKDNGHAGQVGWTRRDVELFGNFRLRLGLGLVR